MLNQEYYDFHAYERITNNINQDFISGLEAIIELSKSDPDLCKDLFDIRSHDIEQLKRLNNDDAKEIINVNPELFCFNITAIQIEDAKRTKFTLMQNYQGSNSEKIIAKYYDAQRSSLLELIDLIKSGGKDLASLIYQVNEDALDLLLEMRPLELHSIVEKLQYSMTLNENYSTIPVSDTVILMSSTGQNSIPQKRMLIDSILNTKNYEDSQVEFQEDLLAGKIKREKISMEDKIPQNTSLVWTAHDLTSTDKFIYLYLGSNFRKILKAKTALNQTLGKKTKIFPDDSIKTKGKLKSTSFSWVAGRFEQLKIYLVTSLYSRVFNNSEFKRFPTLHEITLVCFAFELRYRLRNTDVDALDLSHIHRILNKMPLIHGETLEKDEPGFEDLKKINEDPQPGLIKSYCKKCSFEIYTRTNSNASKCVWCIEGLRNKKLTKLNKINSMSKINKLNSF